MITDGREIVRLLAELDAHDIRPVLTGEIAGVVGDRNVSIDILADDARMSASVRGAHTKFSMPARLDVSDSVGNQEYDVIVSGLARDHNCQISEIHLAA